MARDDAATARWREAFAGCRPTLEALARATDDNGRATARAWWVICMGNRVAECKGAYAEWKEQAAEVLPRQLTAEHTEEAIKLPGFETLGRCILSAGAAVGVDPAVTLNTVEAHGARTEWVRAVGEVEPLRQRLQQNFLASKKPPSFLQRAFARGDASKKDVPLAASAGEMQIDELRVCQVWMYGLASRLSECQHAASEFAASAHMSDPNSPLAGYDEEKWDPREPVWQRMEACVHAQAANAGAEADQAWRLGMVPKAR